MDDLALLVTRHLGDDRRPLLLLEGRDDVAQLPHVRAGVLHSQVTKRKYSGIVRMDRSSGTKVQTAGTKVSRSQDRPDTRVHSIRSPEPERALLL